MRISSCLSRETPVGRPWVGFGGWRGGGPDSMNLFFMSVATAVASLILPGPRVGLTAPAWRQGLAVGAWELGLGLRCLLSGAGSSPNQTYQSDPFSLRLKYLSGLFFFFQGHWNSGNLSQRPPLGPESLIMEPCSGADLLRGGGGSAGSRACGWLGGGTTEEAERLHRPSVTLQGSCVDGAPSARGRGLKTS